MDDIHQNLDNDKEQSFDLKNEHSFLNSSKSFRDYFDDLAETESADTERLQKGKR